MHSGGGDSQKRGSGLPLQHCQYPSDWKPPTPDNGGNCLRIPSARPRTPGCPMSHETTSRRSFLRHSTVAAAAVAIAACEKQTPSAAITQQGTKGPATGGTMGAHDTGTGAV